MVLKGTAPKKSSLAPNVFLLASSHWYRTPRIPSYLEQNDASLAFLVHHRYGNVMVMGDLERRGEANLLTKSLPRVNVLRAGHHGSRTTLSSTHEQIVPESRGPLSWIRESVWLSTCRS